MESKVSFNSPSEPEAPRSPICVNDKWTLKNARTLEMRRGEEFERVEKA